MLAFIIMLLVFVAISVGQFVRWPLRIWHIMAGGAVLMLATLQIGPLEAIQAIDFQVIGFLAGMFVIGEGMKLSGLLAAISHRLFDRTNNPFTALLLFMLLAGLGSALLTNDTIAIVGTPMALLLSSRYGAKQRVTLLALAIAVTIGSVFSPLGNPQNLLIALDPHVHNAFVDFAFYLALPTLVSMVLAWALLCLFFRKQILAGSDRRLHQQDNSGAETARISATTPTENHSHHHMLGPIDRRQPIPDRPHTHGYLVRLCVISVVLLVALVVLRVVSAIVHFPLELPLWLISVVAALPLLLFSKRPIALLKGVDWQTLVFFAALFICVAAVWHQGVLQEFLSKSSLDLGSQLGIVLVCIVASQLVSNVPLVALFLPILATAGAHTESYMVMAAASTLAGNVTVLGAASNVIIIQRAQAEAGKQAAFGAWDIAKIGIPLTALSLGLFWVWWTLV